MRAIVRQGTKKRYREILLFIEAIGGPNGIITESQYQPELVPFFSEQSSREPFTHSKSFT